MGMQIKRLKAVVFGACMLAVFLLSACELAEPKPFSVRLMPSFPVCYANESYNLMQTVEAQDDAEYLFLAYRGDSDKGAAVSVVGTSFVPDTAGAYFIRVTGIWQSKTDVKAFALQAVQRDKDEEPQEPPAGSGVYELKNAAALATHEQALASLTLGNIVSVKPAGGTRPTLIRSNTLDEITVTLPSKGEAAADYGSQGFITGEVRFPLTLAGSVNVHDAIFCVSVKEESATLTGVTLLDKAGILSETLPVCISSPQGSKYVVAADAEHVGYSALGVALDQFDHTRQGTSGAYFSVSDAKSLILTFSNAGNDGRSGAVRLNMPLLCDDARLPFFEHVDLSAHPSVTSVKTDQWGNASALTTESFGLAGYTSRESRKASLNGVSLMPEVYSGNEIWSWIKIPVAEIYGGTVDLSNKCLSWMMDVTWAHANASVILVDKNGVYSHERGIGFADTVIPHMAQAYTAYANALLERDFLYHLFFDFSGYDGAVFSQRSYPSGTKFDVTACKEILITISNAGRENAAVLFDFMFLLDGVPDGVIFYEPPVARTYRLNDSSPENIDVLCIGNSFIYSSEVGKTLQRLADENEKRLRVESYSLGGAVGSALLSEAALGYNTANQTSWGYKLFSGGYDYLVIQANFWESMQNPYYNRVEEFAAGLFGLGTQIVLMPAYNEGGQRNGGYDVIDWYGLDWALRADVAYDFETLLQYGADKWHANVLSGYGAALLCYDYFFGEAPYHTAQTEAMIKEGWLVKGTSISQYEYSALRVLPEPEAQAIFNRIKAYAFGLLT